MNSKLLSIILVSITVFSCKRDTKHNDIKITLNKTIKFPNYKTVINHKEAVFDIKTLLSGYNYKYIVCLQDHCKPCYLEFIRWHKELAKITTPNDFTIVFIIQGYCYESFMKQIKMLEDIDNDYCVIMDPNYEFIDANSKIPRWIIDASMLIDSENRIKIVGVPWLNNDMEELFLKTINSGK
jgi:mRNA-degrading endonuclease HigB of HigAB toxin-antitoxin module